MANFIRTASVLCAAAAMVGCSSDTDLTGANGVSDVGSVEFNLDLPNGESVDEIELNLVCAGIDQDHVLDVSGGSVVAAFGGLAPGECTVTLHSATEDGRDCDGAETFNVVASQKVDVDVLLVCQGDQTSDDGQVKVRASFEVRECAEDRIVKLYAIPSNLELGDSTTIEVETANEVGTASYSWEVVQDATHTADGDLSATAACSPNSASCIDFACTALGAAQAINPDTGLPTDGVWIEVTVEDDECFDRERVWVECEQASVCGDGNVEGVEECDDNNTNDNDGCSALCIEEICGDGILHPGEECDGDAGVGDNQVCDANCNLTDLPYCGDGTVNQASEQCDGTDGLVDPGVQTCDANCQIESFCGNGIPEPGEYCDDQNTDENDGCRSDCTQGDIVDTGCIDCIDSAGDSSLGGYVATNCSADPAHEDCRTVMQCYIDNGCYDIGFTPAVCFCGNDLANCTADTFTPVGVCAQEILDGGGSSFTNAQIVGGINGGLAAGFSDAGLIMSFTTQGGQPCFGDCQP